MDSNTPRLIESEMENEAVLDSTFPPMGESISLKTAFWTQPTGKSRAGKQKEPAGAKSSGRFCLIKCLSSYFRKKFAAAKTAAVVAPAAAWRLACMVSIAAYSIWLLCASSNMMLMASMMLFARPMRMISPIF